MIEGLDHVAVAVPDLAAAVADYAALFGGPAAAEDTDHAWFVLANTRLLLLPAASGAAPGIAWLGFAAADPAEAARLFARRRLPAADAPPPWPEAAGPAPLALAPEAANGLDLRLLPPVPPAGTAAATGLDHVVIRTGNPDRAVALFGGRLGLNLRLDRSAPQWGTRFLFFRCGDLVVEVTQPLAEDLSGTPDAPRGLAWRATRDVAGEHARLAAAGLPVSPLREGRKPGTRIFTLRGGAAAPVPTAVIGAG